ncbi:hypothetical protein CsSME_00005160 [Camellia sinensis var. sinensis]
MVLSLSRHLCYPDPSHENNGKASILSNATRLLRDLLAQVDCLKMENTTLLSESHYVSFLKSQPAFLWQLNFLFPEGKHTGPKFPFICFKENLMVINRHEYPMFFYCCMVDSM